MSALILRASPAHLPGIVERWEDLVHAHRALDPELYATAQHAPGTYRAFVRRQMDKRDGLVLVALGDEGAVDGYLVGGKGQRAPTYAIRDVGMIFDLVVEPGARRAGLGRALVDRAIESFGARGLTHVHVNFSPHNPSAAGFWPSLGFRPFLYEAYLPIEGSAATEEPC